jgi:hypothetical protein
VVLLVLVAGPVQGQESNVTVVGLVIAAHDSTPIQGAEVLLIGAAVEASTDSLGRFELTDLPAGNHLLRIRCIGYKWSLVRADLEPGQVHNFRFELHQLPLTLPPVIVEGVKPENYKPSLEEFYERRREGFGYFLTREQIEELHPAQPTDLFWSIPGVQLIAVGGGTQYRVRLQRQRSKLSGGGDCPPHHYIDGMFVRNLELDLDISVANIEALEVYRGPSETPSQYRRPDSDCGVILIWTRRLR